MIFKVQLSHATTAQKQQMLIYNEDRSLTWQSDATDDVIRLMDGRSKAFFLGRQLDDGQIELGALGDVPDPGW